ncbi:hypothetical protein F52700_7349 [Fusarium sp. NRRL 52700]|nr:hypothetical protein F52700_7349 [Fusarium sp. NRRL 52700]
MPPKKPGRARKRPQAEVSRSPSPSRPAKHPKLSASPPPSPEEKKTRKSNKPDEGCPGWWSPEYAPAGKLLPANKAGMRKVIKAFQDANRDPTELESSKIDFENLMPKTPSQTQREEVPSSEDEQAPLDRENTEPIPDPLAESITLAETSILQAKQYTGRQPQITNIAKPMSATIDAIRNGDALDSLDMTRCANLFPRPSDWYIFPPGSSFTDDDKIDAQHSALKAQHIAFFVHDRREDQWALCHLDMGKATLVHQLTNISTKVPAEGLVDWLRSQQDLNMKSMMFMKKLGPIQRDRPSGSIYALFFLKCLMAKERVPRYVDIATARMEFIKMIRSADTDENMVTRVPTSAQDAVLNGNTIPAGTPKDHAVPVDPELQVLLRKSFPAQSSTRTEPINSKQELAPTSPCPAPKQSVQTVLISSSESSPKPAPDEPEFGEPVVDEATEGQFVSTAPTDNIRGSETNTPLSDPDDPLIVAQSLEANFAAFLNQRRKLEACVKAERSSVKKNDETIAELKQAPQELIDQRSSTIDELKHRVSELEKQLDAAKGELEATESAQEESDFRLTELGDKIRGEKRSKAEAAERIKQWEATLAKTAFQSI